MGKRTGKKRDNIESLIDTVGFIKDNMVTREDLKEDLKEFEESLAGKIAKVESALGTFEKHEVEKRLQLEVRVTKLERKVLS